MCDDVILIGAGGHAKVVADIILKSGDTLLGFLDDDPQKRSVLNYPVLGRIDEWEKYAMKGKFLLAVGDSRFRESLAEKIQAKWYTAIHPSAQIGTGAGIGEGSTVMANAVINSGATIGRHSIVNTAAVVEHDCRIGDYAHISVGAKLGGTVQVGRCSWIGIGAVVKNNLSICDDCLVGAGGVVVQDILEQGTYVGIPARRRG